MNRTDTFKIFIEEFISNRQNVDNQYLQTQLDRLSRTIDYFGLDQSQDGQRILEIGPYLTMTPFFYQSLGARRITVLDGDSPEIHRLTELYRAQEIAFVPIDLEALSGPKEGRLPFPDEEFDKVLCWETIEHFNFNPIPFVDEVKRVTCVGGDVFVTVPNIAKVNHRLALLRGRSPLAPVDNFVKQMDPDQNFKYGLHWKEYTLNEITELFAIRGFKIVKSGHLQTYEKKEISALRSLKRGVGSIVTKIIPSLSSLCCLIAKRVD